MASWLTIARNAEPSSYFFLGCCLQLFLTVLLPFRLAFLSLFALISGYAVWRNSTLWKPSKPPFSNAHSGRWTAKLVDQHDKSSDVVVFIVGVTLNHPDARLAPEFKELSQFFQTIWKDVESDSEKWGYLGRTTPMAGTRPESKNIIVTISYWRNMESLHAVAFGPAHRAGWNWWNKVTMQYPHLGIFHEVYVVPGGRWTNAYANTPPLGMGKSVVDKRGRVGSEGILKKGGVSQWSAIIKDINQSGHVDGNLEEQDGTRPD